MKFLKRLPLKNHKVQKWHAHALHQERRDFYGKSGDKWNIICTILVSEVGENSSFLEPITSAMIAYKSIKNRHEAFMMAASTCAISRGGKKMHDVSGREICSRSERRTST